MIRLRDLAAVTLPAALLALAVQPLLDTAAPASEAVKVRGDRLDVGLSPGAEPLVIRVDAGRSLTVVARDGSAGRGPVDVAPQAQEIPSPAARPRQKEGCEGAISGLAGMEARRMLPSRCLT